MQPTIGENQRKCKEREIQKKKKSFARSAFYLYLCKQQLKLYAHEKDMDVTLSARRFSFC